VYFHAAGLLDCAKSSGADIADLTRVVAVHEWFHAFMEQALGTAWGAHEDYHGAKAFCRLEEAAADRVARDWMLAKLPAGPSRDAIDEALFMWAERHAVPGYGERKHLDPGCPGFLPSMARAARHADPPGYELERNTLAFTADAFARSSDAALWLALLSGIEDETLPCYLDLRGLLG
jgi:hypothetical protein